LNYMGRYTIIKYLYTIHGPRREVYPARQKELKQWKEPEKKLPPEYI